MSAILLVVLGSAIGLPAAEPRASDPLAEHYLTDKDAAVLAKLRNTQAKVSRITADIEVQTCVDFAACVAQVQGWIDEDTLRNARLDDVSCGLEWTNVTRSAHEIITAAFAHRVGDPNGQVVWLIDDGMVICSTREGLADRAITRVFPCKHKDAPGWVRSLIAPARWKKQKQWSVARKGETLTVTAPLAQQEQVLQLLTYAEKGMAADDRAAALPVFTRLRRLVYDVQLRRVAVRDVLPIIAADANLPVTLDARAVRQNLGDPNARVTLDSRGMNAWTLLTRLAAAVDANAAVEVDPTRRAVTISPARSDPNTMLLAAIDLGDAARRTLDARTPKDAVRALRRIAAGPVQTREGNQPAAAPFRAVAVGDDRVCLAVTPAGFRRIAFALDLCAPKTTPAPVRLLPHWLRQATGQD